MSALIKHLREQAAIFRRDDSLGLGASKLEDAADALEANAVLIEQQALRIAELEAHVELLRQELKNIANADTIAWDDPTEFEAWAKNRARHTLAALAKQQAQEG